MLGLRPLLGLGWFPILATGNWLLQCTSCIDQAYYSDESQKRHVAFANTSDLYYHVTRLVLNVYDHKHDEFFNKFFSRSQLGLEPDGVKQVLPGAISTLPERRWTAANGTVMQMKNVDLVRDSQIMLTLLGSTQEIIKRFELHTGSYHTWKDKQEKILEEMDRTLADMYKELNYSRQKREEMVEQIVRAVTTSELVQKNLARTEGRVAEVKDDVLVLKRGQETFEERLANTTEHMHTTLNAYDRRMELHERRVEDRFTTADARSQRIEETAVATTARLDGELATSRAGEAAINASLARAWQELEKEASADVVERRRIAEAEVELALAKMQHDKLRFSEEQEAVKLKHEEQRRTEELADERDRKRIAEELAGRAAHEKEMLRLNEEMQHRLNQETFDAEKERLKMQLELDREKAEMEMKSAAEKARIDADAKIRDKRENADLYMEELKAKAQEDKEKLLAAIQQAVDQGRKLVPDYVFSNSELERILFEL